MYAICINILVQQVEVLRASLSGTVGTHPLRHGSRTAIEAQILCHSFVTPANFLRAVTVRTEDGQ